MFVCHGPSGTTPTLEPCLEFREAARHSVRDLPLALDPTDLVERPGRYDLAKAVEFGLGGVFEFLDLRLFVGIAFDFLTKVITVIPKAFCVSSVSQKAARRLQRFRYATFAVLFCFFFFGFLVCEVRDICCSQVQGQHIGSRVHRLMQSLCIVLFSSRWTPPSLSWPGAVRSSWSDSV